MSFCRHLFLALAVVLGPLGLNTASASDEPSAVVERWHTTHFAKPAPTSLDVERAVLEEVFDVRVMALSAIGRGWKKLSDEQFNEYLALYAEHLQSALDGRRKAIAERDVRIVTTGVVDARNHRAYEEVLCSTVSVILSRELVSLAEAQLKASKRRVELLKAPRSVTEDAELSRIENETLLREAQIETLETAQSRNCQITFVVASFGDLKNVEERVVYIVMQVPTAWRVVDVHYGKVSMVMVHRSGFSAITGDQADVQRLLAALRKKYAH